MSRSKRRKVLAIESQAATLAILTDDDMDAKTVMEAAVYAGKVSGIVNDSQNVRVELRVTLRGFAPPIEPRKILDVQATPPALPPAT